MRNRYNFYYHMLRAAAGDPPGGAVDDDAGNTSNAKTINADDVEDPPADTMQAGGGEDTLAAGTGDDTVRAGGGDDAVKPKPAVVPREAMLKRVGDLTRDKTALKTENERLKAERDALIAARVKPADGETEPAAEVPVRSEFKTQVEFDAAVRAETQRRVDQQQFDNRCNAVADVGEKEFKDDWSESVANLRMLSDDGNIPKLLLDAALESDNPAQALHHLGQHPDQAMEIMSLTPIQQVARVTKLGTKKAAAAPKPKTNAPEPIDPLNGGGSADSASGLGDEVDDETWYANRQAELRANALGAAKR